MKPLNNLGAPGPLDIWRAWLEVGHLAVESHMVVSMRVLGLMGLWPVSNGENQRMVGEKLRAMAEVFEASQRSIWRGDRPDEMATAALRPIRRRTYVNSRRLTRRSAKTASPTG
ncbi:hypothetical protein [Actibacterium sp. XHP0104]|uniref:hypothetical protein n=1 Tax=Actibacterium sp. XHP0104 TaxID=2984335 RepID=UPI0021E93C7B|nr:hypothetical protein [Actibacterium sp. XHP0104]MCV2880742.1 hypothetical protein [Actibacterium sp. XHP0104]